MDAAAPLPAAADAAEVAELEAADAAELAELTAEEALELMLLDELDPHPAATSAASTKEKATFFIVRCPP